MFYSVTNKKFLKDGMKLRMKNFNIMGIQWKNVYIHIYIYIYVYMYMYIYIHIYIYIKYREFSNKLVGKLDLSLSNWGWFICVMVEQFCCTVVKCGNLLLRMRRRCIGWSIVWSVFNIYVYIVHYYIQNMFKI